MSESVRHLHLEVTKQGYVLISGTRYKAKQLAAEHFQFGWTSEELLRQHPDLRPEQVYSVLTWFYDNYAVVVAELNTSLEQTETLRKSPQCSSDELLRRALSAGE